MSEAPSTGSAAPAGKGKTDLGFLTRKVGPLPLGVWIVAAAGIWWWTRRGSGTGAATDPAGNVGVIDPATGYVYGSPQDTAALSGQIGGGSGGGGGSAGGGSGSTTAGQYADNNAWSRAAVNYLVGIGVDPTQANEAIQSFLSSAPLTSAQQADVNLAIQALGPPPTLPGPVGSPGGPVVTPPGGGAGGTPGGKPGDKPPGGGGDHDHGPSQPPPPSGGSKTPLPSNPPTGLAVAARTRNSISLKWNRVANATEYEVFYVNRGVNRGSLSGQPYDLIGGLDPATSYTFRVRGRNAADMHDSRFATITASTTS